MNTVSAGGISIVRKIGRKFSICTSICAGLVFISPSRGITDANATPLQDQISDLKSEIIQLKLKDPAAFSRLHAIIMQLQAAVAQANPSGGVLMVCPFVSVKRGTTLDFPITLIDGQSQPVALQGQLNIPSGFTLVSVTAGPATIAAGKNISNNGGLFIIFGVNQTTIQPGVVAIAKLSVPASAPAALVTIPIINVAATDKDGSAMLISNVSGTVKVTP